ncbi:MAG: TetR/AcrR family transcriptional regulator [Actinomycetota bacterium]|nr:TetR family transcriptional regulator [Actinomycetota bacterium]
MTTKKAATHDPATRDRIVRAALETLREEGFAGTTARAIAARGDFNQALIFYYFGSVAALLVEAFRNMSEAQVAKYRAAAAEVRTLTDLVEIARRLHAEDLESGSVTAVTQLMAAAVSDEDVGKVILDRFQDWIALVEEALKGALADQPLGGLVPARQAAYAIAGMFLGIELISRLDPERSEAEAVFDMMGSMAQLVEQFAPMLAGFVQG